ncbi:MAG TPA: AzlD domain-containing protein [Thermomicrobiales bacterium]
MSTFWAILGMAVGVYAIRLGGFALADAVLPPRLEQSLIFVPVAMLAALCASTLVVGTGDLPIRLIAAVGGGLVMRFTNKTWACIVGGMLLYWVLGRL